jgi:hypothetical protein
MLSRRNVEFDKEGFNHCRWVRYIYAQNYRLSIPLVFAHVAEGERITQSVHLRDAVLPLEAGRPAQEVGRTGLRNQVHSLPVLLAYHPPHPEHARREERDADNFTEDGLITVPSDARAGSVLRD